MCSVGVRIELDCSESDCEAFCWSDRNQVCSKPKQLRQDCIRGAEGLKSYYNSPQLSCTEKPFGLLRSVWMKSLDSNVVFPRPNIAPSFTNMSSRGFWIAVLSDKQTKSKKDQIYSRSITSGAALSKIAQMIPLPSNIFQPHLGDPEAPPGLYLPPSWLCTQRQSRSVRAEGPQSVKTNKSITNTQHMSTWTDTPSPEVFLSVGGDFTDS